MWIDAAANFQKSLAALPLIIYQAGETVLANGSRTGPAADFSGRAVSQSSSRVSRSPE